MDIEKYYNINLVLTYENNFEFRECLRKLFFMNNMSVHPDIDSETQDEMDFDETTISNAMDKLFDITKDNLYFQQLYQSAAALMMSTDLSIGQAVLFSYDNLKLFHSCLGSYFNNPSEFNENNTSFSTLKQKIS